MKQPQKFAKLLLVSLTLGLAVFIACRNDSNSTIPNIDFSAYLNQYNEGKSPETKGKILKGKIHLQGTKDNNLVLWVEGDLNVENKIMFLQSSTKVDSNYGLVIPEGEILFLTDYLLVKSSNNKHFYFVALSVTKPQIDLSQIKFDNKFAGYGLIFTENPNLYNEFVKTSNKGLVTRTSYNDPYQDTGSLTTVDDVSCKCRTNGSSDRDCTSGGKNSTSCSESTNKNGPSESCTVTCGSGSYSCCIN